MKRPHRTPRKMRLIVQVTKAEKHKLHRLVFATAKGLEDQFERIRSGNYLIEITSYGEHAPPPFGGEKKP